MATKIISLLTLLARSRTNSALRRSLIPGHDHLTCFNYAVPSYSRPDSYSSVLRSLFLAGVAGAGVLEIAYADAGEVVDLATQERKRLEARLLDSGMEPGSYPPFTVRLNNGKVFINIKVPPKCRLSRSLMMANLANHLGEMKLEAWCGIGAWDVTLENTRNHAGVFSAEISESNYKPSEIEFEKEGSFGIKEIDAIVSTLKLAGTIGDTAKVRKPSKGFTGDSKDSSASGETPSAASEPKGSRVNGSDDTGGQSHKKQGDTLKKVQRDSKYNSASLKASVTELEAMGVKVYGVDETSGIQTGGTISWDNIAGYHQQKRDIEDTILLALRKPKVYEKITHGTRCKFESNRPRAILFEGPPGTGKTYSARLIAKQAGIPLVYVPVEVIMSKWYGESERMLGKIFRLANELPDGAIIFLDEVDSFAAARDGDTHESNRRILSILLCQIDGFEHENKVVVMAATNRKQDLDPAFINRFDAIIPFGLPDQQTREEIAAQYAKHLTKTELGRFALATDKMSGRDIRDICQQTERRWASKVIRDLDPKDDEDVDLPPVEEYLSCAESRRKSLLVSSSKNTDIDESLGISFMGSSLVEV